MKWTFGAPLTALALVVMTLASGTVTGQAHAQTQNEPSPVTLRSDVKIERIEQDASGNPKATLLTPQDVAVVPGDNVVFTLAVNNTGTEPATGFKAINPIPAAVRFASVAEDWAEVSVDGGNVWGKLATLKIKAKDEVGAAEVERPATADDVTHVRWVFKDAIGAGTQRIISYRGVVK